ncbi:hypothetical protein [Rhizobium sp. MHM7A]|uniref:hypothetical protein n=1 Tax=Rhizobium sp. MHM7A TaxID=2583233 RepID=UPI0011063469|nr:hypothetical protein [Rhizobium sp. MHM7A]TLX15952.1 hypothetical protein FFR93_01150 [Rhizobium sp. MHM7A]
MKDTLLLATACLSAVRSRADEISAANAKDQDLPRSLLQEEANDIVRGIVRSEVRYDANEIPTYLKRFPDLLKVQSGGGELNHEIEDSLHRSYTKLIRPHLNTLLLTQYEDFTLESITQTLADTDRIINHKSEPAHLFSKAVAKLRQDPDHNVLAELIVRIHLLNQDLAEQGVTYTGEGLREVPVSYEGAVNRLNEIRDYLDLLLEGDGFDALLSPDNGPRP